MADDLEAFLQRAAQKRKKRPAQIVVLEPKPVEPIVVADAVAPTHQPLTSSHTPATTELPRHFENRDFVERAAHMGERVGLADDMLDAHLKSTFDDHQVGTFARQGADKRLTDDEVVLEGPTLAEEVVKMFQSPGNMRRAILLNEILTSPAERWEGRSRRERPEKR